MIHSRKIVAGALFLTLIFAQATFAEDFRGAAESTSKKISTKLWRGCVNYFTGIGELPRQIILCTQEDGVAGVPVGIINGVFMSVVRTLAGAAEVVTFPFPLDETTGYDSIMEPDYCWQSAE